MLHRILSIIKVTPYTIICEWAGGEVSAIPMEAKLKEWADEPGSVYKKLLNKDVFMKVNLDTATKTLYWNELIQMKDS